MSNFKILLTGIILLIFHSVPVFAQTDFVKTDGITSELHRANTGKITFMSKLIPVESYQESDFLKTFELRETGDLNIRVFMADSLTNYLHRLAPDLAAEELVKRGNYRFSFYVDKELVYTENLNAGAGLPEQKNTRTVWRVPLMSSTDEDSWGRFLWVRFMFNGGAESLTAGEHLLKMEIRPYLKTGELKIGDLIAGGELKLKVIRPAIDEKLAEIQSIKPVKDWKISRDAYDREKIKLLNRKIAENVFKKITSIVVIKNGQILIEEYFNGAARDSLHDTRSVGKSFASAVMGIAIDDGLIKSEDQTLRDFYDLTKFANYSAKKESVTLKSLLTMSSGFDADDNDENSPGNEEKMYPTADWVKFALDLPMDEQKEIGKNWSYFTGGVVVLGDILNKSVPGGLEKYADQKLFRPLGIKNYRWQYTPQKVANTAGGLRMSALDLAKFGQLYQNGGRWNGKQIISGDWAKKSMTKYLKLPMDEYDSYGYLFWNMNFNVNNQSLETFFATGNGGNKIFVFKDQPLVVVITATAYGQGWAHAQANRIMERYVLPAVLR